MSSRPPARKRACRHVSLPILIDSRLSSEGLLMAENRRGTKKKRNKKNRVISIDMLPDDVLLAIFDFCAHRLDSTKRVAPPVILPHFGPLPAKHERPKYMHVWHLLVHVCRRWRSVVFGSPRRLNLQLLCTAKTRARDTLDIWPALPLVIRPGFLNESVHNIARLLKCSDRVHQIDLSVSSSQLEKVLATMLVPFPELTYLWLESYGETVPVLHDSFLGQFAPHLEFLRLLQIPFPCLPKLLLSATHLVDLRLRDIPYSGYISPEEMITALSTLTSLNILWLGFQSPRSRPDPEDLLPPPTRSVLPALSRFWFKGVSEYLDDFVARTDAPRLNDLSINLFNQIVFDTPQLIQFISRTPMLNVLEEASVDFGVNTASVDFSSQTFEYGRLNVKISCETLDWQVSSLEQVCTSCLPPLSTLEDLYIDGAPYWQPDVQDNIDSVLWLELLRPFTAVKNLYISQEFAPRVMPALQELVGDRTTEVVPMLQKILLKGQYHSQPLQEGIGQFIATRQDTSHPIEVLHKQWYRPSY